MRTDVLAEAGLRCGCDQVVDALHQGLGIAREEKAREVIASRPQAVPQDAEQLPAVRRFEPARHLVELELKLVPLALQGLLHKRRVAERDASDLDAVPDHLAMLRHWATVPKDTNRNREVGIQHAGGA